jgi:HK97 family phage major capsid protein
MVIEELNRRLHDIDSELEKLGSYTHPTKGQVNRCDALIAEGTDLRRQLADAQARAARISEAHRKNVAEGRAISGNAVRKPDDEYDRQNRSEAGRTLDDAHRAGLLPDYAAERAEALLNDGPTGERGLASRWVVAAGAPAYRSAFAKLLADPTRGHLLWDAREHDAYRAVATVQAEMESRTAMSTTVGNGGYMIPLTLDPAIMLTNDGSNNPLRRLATVKQTLTSSWNGITSAGATAEWKTEAVKLVTGRRRWRNRRSPCSSVTCSSPTRSR